MAEAKNTFLKSKMNQDLDDRLVPNGEYREGLNIAVSRSEGDDVGALEDILGNGQIAKLLPSFTITISNLSGDTFDYISDVGVSNGDYRISVGYEVFSSTSQDPIATVLDVSGYGGGLIITTPSETIANGDVLTIKPSLTIIGVEPNQNTDKVYLFATNYTDTSFDKLSNYCSIANPNGGQCAIFEYNLSTPSIAPKALVEGAWLNLSTTQKILNANILEDLLFWTDDRNQPRKINISNAISNTFTDELQHATNNWGYYKNEDHISVAKYAPITPIQLWKEYDDAEHINGPSYETTMRDVVSEKLPDGTTDNPYYNPNYAGDPDFLEDKFVKFSYRFKFDDNEYSLMAPFTQAAFIPKQDGYFLEGDEKEAFSSTLVKFMENKVNNILLRIPMPLPLEASPNIPDQDNFMQCDQLESLMHVKEIEILYKESDALSVQVLEKIDIAEITSQANAKFFEYDYQVRKPFRTLPEKDLVRVYDKIPPRAKTQEVISNRIVYGNYVNKLTPPKTLNYNVALSDKYALSEDNLDKGYTSIIEYPQHTVKHNRNYEVAIVLADRYGRSSSPILSEVADAIISQGINYGGSTFYAPYRSEELPGQQLNESSILEWPGDSIKVLFNSPIVSNRSNLLDNNVGTGTPGVFSYDEYTSSAMNPLGWYTYKVVVKQQEQSYYNIYLPGIINSYPAGPIAIAAGSSQTAIQNPGTNYSNAAALPTVGGAGTGLTVTIQTDTGTGVVTDVSISSPGSGYSFGDVLTVIQSGSNNDCSFLYSLYDLSYSNFVPGNSLGPPVQPAIEGDSTAFTTLFSDNINKLPRDLEEVGPEQKQYRSSVSLYGRVTNDDFTVKPYNSQFFPARQSHSADQIAEGLNLVKIPEEKNLNPPTGLDNNPSRLSLSIYQNETNPYLVRLSTDKAIGQRDQRTVPNANVQYGDPEFPILAVYETEPTMSNLEIYWETSTWGWLGRLNELISTSTEAPIDITPPVYTHFENQDPSGIGTGTGTADSPYVTDLFQPILQSGLTDSNCILTDFVVTSSTGIDRTADFAVETGPGNIGDPGYGFRIKIANPFYYGPNATTVETYSFNFNVAQASFPDDKLAVFFQGSLQNNEPTITNCSVAQSGALNVLPGVTNLFTFTATNGTNDVARNALDLIFSFSDGTNSQIISGTNIQFDINASTGNLVLANGNPTGSYPLSIKVIDAAGGPGFLFDTCNVVVNYGLVEVPEAFTDICNGAPLGESYDGDNFTLQWNATAEVLNGFPILSAGSDYTTATNLPTAYTGGSSGNGSGLTFDIVADTPLNGGGILEVTVNNPGSGYNIGESVRVLQNSSPGGGDSEIVVSFDDQTSRCPSGSNGSFSHYDTVNTLGNSDTSCGGDIGLIDLPANSRLMITAEANCGLDMCWDDANQTIPYNGTMECYHLGNFYVEYKPIGGNWGPASDIKGLGSGLGTLQSTGGGTGSNAFRGLYSTGSVYSNPTYFPGAVYQVSNGGGGGGYGRYRIFEGAGSYRVVSNLLTGNGPCFKSPSNCSDYTGDMGYVLIYAQDGFYDTPACAPCGDPPSNPSFSYEYMIKSASSGDSCPPLPGSGGYDPYGIGAPGATSTNPGNAKRVWASAFKHLYVEQFFEDKELTTPLQYGEYKTGYSLTENSNIVLKQTGRRYVSPNIEINNLPLPGFPPTRVYDGGLFGNGTYKARLLTNGEVGQIFAGSNATHGSVIRDPFAFFP